VETPSIPSENGQNMSEQKGERRAAIGQEAHQRPSRSDRAASPVVNDPEAHEELAWSSANETPAENKIGPPNGNPEAK